MTASFSRKQSGVKFVFTEMAKSLRQKGGMVGVEGKSGIAGLMANEIKLIFF